MEIERKYTPFHEIWRPCLLAATLMQVCMCIVSASFANVLHFCFSFFSAVISAATYADWRYTTLVLNCFMQVTLGSGLVYVDLLRKIDENIADVPRNSGATKWLIFTLSLLSFIATIALLLSQKNVVFRERNILSDITSILDVYHEYYEEDQRQKQVELENTVSPKKDVIVTVEKDELEPEKPQGSTQVQPTVEDTENPSTIHNIDPFISTTDHTLVATGVHNEHQFLVTDTKDFVEAIAESVVAKNVEKLHMASVTVASNLAAAFTNQLMIADVKRAHAENSSLNGDVCDHSAHERCSQEPVVAVPERVQDPVIALSESITDAPISEVERLIFEKSKELEDVFYRESDRVVPDTAGGLDPGHGVSPPTSPLVLIGSISSTEVVELVNDEPLSPIIKLESCKDRELEKTVPLFETLERRFENLENEVKRIADIRTEHVLRESDICAKGTQSTPSSPVIKIQVQLAICDKTHGEISPIHFECKSDGLEQNGHEWVGMDEWSSDQREDVSKNATPQNDAPKEPDEATKTTEESAKSDTEKVTETPSGDTDASAGATDTPLEHPIDPPTEGTTNVHNDGHSDHPGEPAEDVHTLNQG